MANRGWSLLVDASMLAAFAALQSWRFTGVPLHEILGTALLGVLCVHLVIHWNWVDSRVRQALRGGGRRTRVNVLLNTLLLLSMATTIASGFYVSKVLRPNRLTPGAYLGWHGLHETASNLTLVVVGLHLALNWDIVWAGVGRAARRRSIVPSPPRASVAGTGVPLLGRIAWVTGLVLLLAIASRQAGHFIATDRKVLFVRADGRRELAAPPPELTTLRPGTDRPAAGAYPKSAATVGLVLLIAGLGRKLLRIRLN